MTAPTEHTEPPPAQTTHHAPLTLGALAAITVVAVAVRLYLMRATHSTAEDFYITLRYAENLAGGHGMAYNVGERVLGTTTPLYTLFLALVHWIGLDPTTWGKVANILADGVSCWLLFRLAASAGLPGAGVVAAALFALSPPNLTWAISGMETSLVTAAGLGVFVSLAEKRPSAMAACAALLVLLRIDGLLLVAVAFSAWWIRERKFPARSFTLLALLILPWLLFATGYYGSPIPTSVVAKLTVYAWYATSAFPNIGPFAHQMTHSPLHLMLLVGAVLGLLAVTRDYRALLSAAAWMMLYYAAMALSKSFLFGWYYVPPSPMYYLLAVVGWSWVAGSLGHWVLAQRPHTARLLSVSSSPLLPHLAVAVLILAFGLVTLPKVRAQLAADQNVEDRLRRPIGETLRGMIQPGEKLMLEPIGYIGYFSRARVLDAVGLVSPEVIPYFRRGAASPYLDIMAEIKPEWVLLRAGEYQDAQKAAVPHERRLERNYVLIRTFADPAAPAGSGPAFSLFRRQSAKRTTGDGGS
jgi:hypothetical protein